jgi:outer membrane cobalamin receptor
MDQLAEAFHRANFEADIVGYYRLQRKLAVFSRWYYVGRRPVQAMDLSAVRPSTIAGYVDGSIGAEYQFNDLIGFDASINNLLSNPYDIWEGYQAQRIRFMLGLSIRW